MEMENRTVSSRKGSAYTTDDRKIVEKNMKERTTVESVPINLERRDRNLCAKIIHSKSFAKHACLRMHFQPEYLHSVVIENK